MYRIRAHHGMCLAFFEGKGYSDKFTRHMWEMKHVLEEDPEVCLVEETDDICGPCPNNRCGVCENGDRVAELDHQVLEHCGLAAGTVLSWKEFEKTVKDSILDAGKRRGICGDCQWNNICDKS